MNTSERWKEVVSERKFWIIVQEEKGLLKYLQKDGLTEGAINWGGHSSIPRASDLILDVNGEFLNVDFSLVLSDIALNKNCQKAANVVSTSKFTKQLYETTLRF